MRKRTRPPGWVRCTNCFGTGYVFTTDHANPEKGILGTITNDKCNKCKGGYIKL